MTGVLDTATERPRSSIKERKGGSSRPTRDTSKPDSAARDERWSAYAELRERVEREGVACMRGNTLDTQKYVRKLVELVAEGSFPHDDAEYLIKALVHGADLGVDETRLPGKVVYKNYKSAFENKEKVTDALRDRVVTGKTLKLGSFDGRATNLPGSVGRVVPMGAVPKKLEPDKVRPFSDHTKSQFNAASNPTRVKHTLNTYEEIAYELRPGYAMRVEDVDGAFPTIPLHPRVWKYMYVHWYDVDRPLSEQDKPNTLYVHVFADFGTPPLPGIWDMFWNGPNGSRSWTFSWVSTSAN